MMRFTALIFPLLACAAGGYLGYNLQTGEHGLKARADLEGRKEVLAGELAGLKEVRNRLERDVALLRPESLDPDMLDERARAILNLAHPDDLVMLKRRQPDLIPLRPLVRFPNAKTALCAPLILQRCGNGIVLRATIFREPQSTC